MVFPGVSVSGLGLTHLVVFVDECSFLPFLFFDRLTFLLSVIQKVMRAGQQTGAKFLAFCFYGATEHVNLLLFGSTEHVYLLVFDLSIKYINLTRHNFCSYWFCYMLLQLFLIVNGTIF